MRIKTLIVLLLWGVVAGLNAQSVHQLAHQGELEKLKEAINQDSSLINMADRRDSTPLHFACDSGHLPVVKYLLVKGANIDARDIDGDTPLSWAAVRGHVEIIKTLIQYGAALDSKNNQGRTPLDWAIQRGHRDAVNIFLDHGLLVHVTGDEANAMLHRAAAFGMQRLADLLLEKGADLNAKNPSRGSILHSAAAGGVMKLTEKAIQTKLDINEKNIFGLTPLHVAAARGHQDLVEFLLKHKANVNLKSENGKTPFQLAMENNHPDIVEMLQFKGAKAKPWQFPKLKAKYLGSKPPKENPELLLPGLISTEEANERDVTFSPDFQEFYYTRWLGGDWKIMMSKKEELGWTQPEPASFCGDYFAAEACVTHDNQQLYFICRRAEEGEKPPIPWRMWFVNRTETGWSEPQSMKKEPFRTGYYPTFTKQGALYFTTAGNDVHVAKLEDGEFKVSTSLGTSVNTEAAEYNACIAPDESYLIFTSLGWGDDFGGGDLYVSFRNGDGSWTQAKNMGEAINSPGHDYCPAISPDGKVFFFTSNRYGTEDIFWVDAKIIEDLKN